MEVISRLLSIVLFPFFDPTSKPTSTTELQMTRGECSRGDEPEKKNVGYSQVFIAFPFVCGSSFFSFCFSSLSSSGFAVPGGEEP